MGLMAGPMIGRSMGVRTGLRRALAAALCALWVVACAGADGPAEPPPVTPEVGSGVPVFGYVLWPGHDVSASQVRICADRWCREVVACAETTGPNGAVFTAVDPGTYYAQAIIDLDKRRAGDHNSGNL